MQYIYIVINRATGFLYGAYANRDHAQQVFDQLTADDETLEVSLSHEPILTKAAYFPNR